MGLIEKSKPFRALRSTQTGQGKNAAYVAEQAERVVMEQSPATTHPKTLALRVARYMVAHNEPTGQAYLFC